ncbi:hypothetical protein AB0E59_42210 [Lentzea sp. NPDC034063]|uniref:hypothetical protein n=1 Tax=unclassified Lentzea TaxID=2643253 RepID=UPI0033CAA471
MAVPKIAAAKPFYELGPAKLPVSPEEAAVPKKAALFARIVVTDEMPTIDLLVCGTVAVNRRESGWVGARDTTIVTMVHDLQIVEGDLPETSHDFSVDVIVTATQVIECGPPRWPAGILWSELDPAKIAAVPALASRAARRDVN